MPLNKTIKEELDNKIVRISVEDFKFVKSSTGAKVIGIALPFDKVSRNQFTYVRESIQNARQTMENKPVLFNHNPDIVIGHNLSAPVTTEGLGYEVDVNPKAINTQTMVPFVESIERGDLKKVSIQCIYDADKSFVDEAGITHAYIQEFLEMSFVSIPGFEDTTAQLIESFKNKPKGEAIMTEDKKSEDIKPTEVPAVTVAPVEAKKEEAPVDNKPADEPKEDPMKKLDERINGIEGRLGNIEKWMKEQTEPTEKPDEDEKREEAIRKDKQLITTESVDQKTTISTKQLKQAFMEVMK